VIRAYTSQDEAHFVIRLPDGKPLAVPVWMTRPEAEDAAIVSMAHLPAVVLFELRRAGLALQPSLVHNVRKENHNATVPNTPPTRSLRGTSGGSRRATAAGVAGATTTGSGAMDKEFGQHDPRGDSNCRRLGHKYLRALYGGSPQFRSGLEEGLRTSEPNPASSRSEGLAAWRTCVRWR